MESAAYGCEESQGQRTNRAGAYVASRRGRTYYNPRPVGVKLVVSSVVRLPREGRSGVTVGRCLGRIVGRAVWLAVALAVAAVPASRAQEADGSTAAALAGGALGVTSGALLGTMGSIPPCWQTAAGVRCVRWSAGIGAAIGVASGVLIGSADVDRVEQAATSAAIGFGVGVAAGLVLRPIAQRFGWQDVLATGLMGGAVGAAPLGAAVGFGCGAAIGTVLWGTVDGVTLPDAVGVGILGMSLGALTEWVVTAIDAQSGGGEASPALNVVLPITVRF